MGLKYNNTDITKVVYNGTSLTQINFNGTPIWYALQSCSISGNAEVGSTLTATVTPSSVQSSCSFQWYAASSSGGAGTAISGATSKAYKLTSNDRTKYIYCVASIGSATAKSNYTAVIKGWVSWSNTIYYPADGGYTWWYPNPDELAINYTVPANINVTKVSATGWIYNHVPEHATGSIIVYINVNGSRVATGGEGSAYDHAHQEASSSCSYSHSGLASGTKITLGTYGRNALKRKVRMTLEGQQLA